MDRELRDSTLIGNIFGNIGRLGSNRPTISPTSAVLKAQESNLYNNLMESRDKRLKAEDAAAAQAAAELARTKPIVDGLLTGFAAGQISYPDLAVELGKLGKGGKEALDVIDNRIKTTQSIAAEQRAKSDQEMQEKEFNDPNKGLSADALLYKKDYPTWKAMQEEKGNTQFAPPEVIKLMQARDNLLNQGYSADHPDVETLNNSIKKVSEDPNADDITMTQEEIDVHGKLYTLTGKMPSLGRGKNSTKLRVAIAKSAARQAMGADAAGIPDKEGKTPTEAAFSMLQDSTDTKSIQTSLNFLDKQTSAMGSFVENIGLQVDKVGELAEELKTYDARILNVPLRLVRGKIAGSALQAKYDMYLTEIESEIGKLATGSVASIAELSATAQEKWGKIHDKNLSIEDMLSLLEETENAAGMRYQSVKNQLGRTRKRMVNRTTPELPKEETLGAFPVEIKSDADYNSLPSGAEFIAPDGSRRRKP